MLTILMYHSIDDLGLYTSVVPERFAAQMAFLVKNHYQILSLDETVALLKSNQPIPRRCATLTFDDGYRCLYTVALEHLRRYSFPATVFVTSGYCGKLSNWPSHRAKYATREMLSASELRELHSSGVTIGSHTVNHHLLTRLSLADAEREIADSQTELEQIVGDRVRHFAYPFGELNDDVRGLVARRYESACGIEFRLGTTGDDIYNLPRIDSLYADDLIWFGGPARLTGRAYVRARATLQDLGIDRVVWATRGRLIRQFVSFRLSKKKRSAP